LKINLKRKGKMKINELRIGNWVLARLVPYQIDEMEVKASGYGRIGLYHNYRIDKGEVRPIPLTEEWLLKLGFENNELIAAHNKFIWFKNHIGISGMLGVVKPVECKYVHQLQNLYFALTGEEL